MNKIALLNDTFRTTLTGGTVLLSAGVHELPDMVKAAAIRKVVSFDDFNEDNDPYGEHDFGKFRTMRVPSLTWWKFGDVVSGVFRLSGHAAASSCC